MGCLSNGLRRSSDKAETVVQLHYILPMCERGNINKCYICGSWVTEKHARFVFMEYCPPKDNTAYNEDICEDCEVVVKDVKEFFKNRLNSQ